MSTIITKAPPATKLTIVNEQLHFPKVALVEPSRSGYIHIAAEVDHRPPFLPGSKTKRDLIRNCKQWCKELEQQAGVVSAIVLRASIIPPGRGDFLKQREGGEITPSIYVQHYARNFTILPRFLGHPDVRDVQHSLIHLTLLAATVLSWCSFWVALSQDNVSRKERIARK